MSSDIVWDSEGQPVSTQFDDVYFSKHNGLAETEYVFLQQNQLQKRFSELDSSSQFIIGETGFGTGLNFLACSRLWHQVAPCNAHLHFVSTEKYPLDKTTLQQALALWPNLHSYSQELLKQYSIITNGIYRFHLQYNITLTLIIDDACYGLKQLLASNHPLFNYPQWNGIDAWFLDGFSPAKNPDMWSSELFNNIAKLSKKNTTCATFTAAGTVRRGLAEVGFQINKVPGYGEKRDMTIGKFDPHLTSIPIEKKQKCDNAPWMVINNYTTTLTNQSIAIIGGGISGCHTAYALARKGYKVTVFEKDHQLASGASGNKQGIVYAKLSSMQEPQGEFNLFCLHYAQQFYQQYWQSSSIEDGQQCGVLQLALTNSLLTHHQNISQRFKLFPEFVKHLSASEASHIAGTDLAHSALFFPNSGWINPVSLCQWLCNHPNITITPMTDVLELETIKNQWKLFCQRSGKKENYFFDTVIISNADSAKHFTQIAHLPIKRIRGQVTHYPVNSISQQLSTAICGQGYIAPALNEHCIGATFNLNSDNLDLTLQDHIKNLENIKKQSPLLMQSKQWDDHQLKQLQGRVGFRCVTPDYLPIVGAAPIEEHIQQVFQELKYDARRLINEAGEYYPKLYLNIGYGSRGLAYAPLCSELLADLIQGNPLPLPQTLAHKLSPARFIIRNIIRSK